MVAQAVEEVAIKEQVVPVASVQPAQKGQILL